MEARSSLDGTVKLRSERAVLAAASRAVAPRRARSPLVPSDGNVPRRHSSSALVRPRCEPSDTTRHDLLSPAWCNATVTAAVVPSKRQRRVLKPFPLLRMVLTRPHKEELQLYRLAQAFAVGEESLTLDQLLRAAGVASSLCSALPEDDAPAPAPSPPMRTVSGNRARLCFELAANSTDAMRNASGSAEDGVEHSESAAPAEADPG